MRLAHRLLIPVSALALLASLGTSSQAAFFDFEAETATYVSPPAGNTRPGALVSLTETDSGLTVTITRQNTTPFDIVDNTTINQNGKPVSWGARSIDPFAVLGTGDFIINFSSPVGFVSLQYGDYGGDSDSATLNAFSSADGGGALVASGSDNSFGTGTFPAFGTVSVSAPGNISSVVLAFPSSGGFRNSAFWDNLTATIGAPAPEPASLGLALLPGLLIGGRFLRRQKRA